MDIDGRLPSQNVTLPVGRQQPQQSPARVEKQTEKDAQTQPTLLPKVGEDGSEQTYTQAFAQAENYQQSTIYDQPQGKAQGAVDAYTSFEKSTQRDHLRDLIGVDIYA